MGVLATWCQLCALPTQHDHYVPSHGGRLAIYRGDLPQGGHDWSREPNRPFAFDERHQWLDEPVGLTWGEGAVPLRGRVSDGMFATTTGAGLFVGDGWDEEALIFHAACWELAGQPSRAEEALNSRRTFDWALVTPYQQQLFDFESFGADGKAPLLVDPRGGEGAASRARIERCLAAARRFPPPGEPPRTVDGVLRFGRDWTGRTVRAADDRRTHLVRRRRSSNIELDGTWRLLRLVRTLGAPGLPPAPLLGALEAFADGLRHSLEVDGRGVVLFVSMGGGVAELVALVRDEAEVRRRVEAVDSAGLPSSVTWESREAATWPTEGDAWLTPHGA